jgi:cytochrome c
MRAALVAGILVLIGVGACAARSTPKPAPEPALEDLVADGRTIAETECSSCHAVGETGESPLPPAPTFRTVLSRYRADVLEEELIQGIHIAHPMPEFQFNPQSVDALIAYLKSIQVAEPDSQ